MTAIDLHHQIDDATMENQIHITVYQVQKQDLESWKADIVAEVISGITNHQPGSAKDSLKLLTRKETSKILNISLPTVDKYSDLGILKKCRVGRRVLYSEESILQSLKLVPDIRYKRPADLKNILQSDEK